MKTVHVTVYGRVHGVGFRQFVKSNAEKLSLVGWVQNNDEGAVECMIQGDNEKVKKLLEMLHVGPMLSDIRKVDVSEMEETFPYESFEIL